MQILQAVVLRIAKHADDKKNISLLVLTRGYGIIWVYIPRQQVRKYGMDIGRVVSLHYTIKNQSAKYNLDSVVGQMMPRHSIGYDEITRVLTLLALMYRIFPLSLPIESIYDDMMTLYRISLDDKSRKNGEYTHALGCSFWRLLGYISHDITPYIHPHHPNRDRMMRCLRAGQSYSVEKLMLVSGVDQSLQDDIERLAHLYLFSPAPHG